MQNAQIYRETWDRKGNKRTPEGQVGQSGPPEGRCACELRNSQGNFEIV